jgi:hypothetical protein
MQNVTASSTLKVPFEIITTMYVHVMSILRVRLVERVRNWVWGVLFGQIDGSNDGYGRFFVMIGKN